MASTDLWIIVLYLVVSVSAKFSQDNEADFFLVGQRKVGLIPFSCTTNRIPCLCTKLSVFYLSVTILCRRITTSTFS